MLIFFTNGLPSRPRSSLQSLRPLRRGLTPPVEYSCPSNKVCYNCSYAIANTVSATELQDRKAGDGQIRTWLRIYGNPDRRGSLELERTGRSKSAPGCGFVGILIDADLRNWKRTGRGKSAPACGFADILTGADLWNWKGREEANPHLLADLRRMNPFDI